MTTRPSVKERALALSAILSDMAPMQITGRVSSLRGGAIDVSGLGSFADVGAHLRVQSRGREVRAEIVGFTGDTARAVAFEPLEGIAPGTPAFLAGRASLPVCDGWLGRIVDPLGRPMDGRGPLLPGSAPRPLRATAPSAGTRARLGERVSLGVRALDAFCTMRRGQRLGLFAGSGVGKSTLLSMLARHANCDVVVLGLVGERGRELREFIEDDLGEEGMRRSVIVCATSDTSPLMRREAAYAATAVAEHFRDAGKSVLLMMDSVTRFAMAMREIGLAAGEPAATKGYTPSVFAELPRLLERAGPWTEGQPGSITALYTVLVDGDDHDEPVADAVRGILDGHVVLDRRIGERGRYPAIDVLRSLSRTVPGCLSRAEAELMRRARAILSTHQEMADLIRLGAYKPGSDRAVDEAIEIAPRIEFFLSQTKDEWGTIEDAFAGLQGALSGSR